MDQDEMKTIMQDILELDLNNDWEVREDTHKKSVLP